MWSRKRDEDKNLYLKEDNTFKGAGAIQEATQPYGIRILSLQSLDKRIAELEEFQSRVMTREGGALSVLSKLEEDNNARSHDELSDAHRLSDIEKHLAGIYLYLGVRRVEITENIYDELMRLVTETRTELRKIAPVKKSA